MFNLMARIKFILHILFLSTYLLFARDFQKMRWGKIYSGSNQKVNFVCGKSKTDFLIETPKGKLLHVKNYKINELLSAPIEEFTELHYYKIDKDDYFCSVVTSKWEGEIYRIRNKVWEKYNITTLAPIRYFFKTTNNLYLIGDFGIILRFTNDRWEEIKTPIESHIITATIDADTIYLATRNDGLVKFDGENFTFLSTNNDEKNIPYLSIIHDTLYGITNNNKVLKFSKNKSETVNNPSIKKYFIAEYSKNFGFMERKIYFNGMDFQIIFPQSFNLNTPRKGSDNVYALEDKSVLLFSSDGYIYFSKKSNNEFFTDLAPIYKVTDLPTSYNIGTAFFDANNDEINDLLVLSKNFGNYLTLYQGVKSSAFANITSISNLPFKDTRISFLTISDFDGDYKKDIIMECRIDSYHKILLYKNLGNFKFTKTDEIILPKDLQTMGIRDLTTFDYDLDGDDDIIVTSYYGEGNLPGYILVYKNNYWGNFNEVDTTFKSFPRRWNEKFIFADITNNDTLDIFNTTLWTRDHLIFGTNTGYIDKTESHFPVQKKNETTNAIFIDYDNDGDLDIFTTGKNDFIRVYSNDGKGAFSETTSDLFSDFLNKEIKNISAFRINAGDFNNDSYTDLIVSLASRDTLYSTFFMNNGGKFFTESPLGLDVVTPTITCTSISDFDNDGDLDIYGTTDRHNLLLVNRLDNNNFLKIKLNGVLSSTSALGSKVWIYKAGKLGNNDFLIGYKQLGTDAFTKNSVNDLTLHFGLGENKKCDIKIKFLSKREITLKNIKAGRTLTVNELPLISATIYRLPGNIYRFLSNKKNRLYILLFIIAHLILFAGLWYGFNKLNWPVKITFIFTVLNLSVFWLSVYLSSFSEDYYLIFLIPFGFTLFVSAIPIVLFIWFNRNSKKNNFIYNDKLLELAMAFSHGEWALRNLNSIILLCENPPENWELNNIFINKLLVRLKTFTDMTYLSIVEIINYEKLMGNNSKELKNLDNTTIKIFETVKQFINGNGDINLYFLSENFKKIRYNIKELRNVIYSRFSSKPTEVINNLIANFETELKNNSINIFKYKKFPNEIPVLIKNYELGNILDNLIQNSIKFMKNSEKKTITIELFKDSPKIIIDFTNTGFPIPKDKWETIFQQGYSESKSTGQGLSFSREILKKYGGRIYVNNSNSEKTTFRIELNEGIIIN